MNVLILLIYLVMPGISAPNPLGALLMGVSGIAWGVYSIRGNGCRVFRWPKLSREPGT